MTIPPHRAPGDIGHIGDHNDVADVLAVHEASIADVDSTVDAHVIAVDPHGTKAYADSTKAAIGHTHNYPVTSVNTLTGVVVLSAATIGAETPAGAQAKVDALGGDIILQAEKGAPDGVAQLDEDGKVLSSQLPAGSGVLSVNGEAGNVILDAADVGALDTAARGAASGVASLDGSTLVPVAQIPGLDGNKIISGTVAIARIPTGSTGSTVSLGNHTHSYPVASVNAQTGTVVLAAADVGALATSARGAASGVASLDGSTLVPVAQIPDLNASKITAGTLNSGRIPDLSASYVTTGPNNNPQITSNATTRGWGRVDLNYTATGGTPDALSFYYGGSGGSGGTRTGYHNEYGELRARPAQTSTVALRAMGHTSGSSAAIFQVTNHDMTITRAEVTETTATFNVPVTVNGAVTGTNLPKKIESGDTLPNPATYTDGDVFLLIP